MTIDERLAIQIELPLFSLKYDKIAEPLVHNLELHSTYLVYDFEAYMDKFPDNEDESKGWVVPKEGVYQKIHLQVRKDRICSMESSWIEDSQLWTLVITYLSTDEHIRIKFKTEKELREVEVKLSEWLFS